MELIIVFCIDKDWINESYIALCNLKNETLKEAKTAERGHCSFLASFQISFSSLHNPGHTNILFDLVNFYIISGSDIRTWLKTSDQKGPTGQSSTNVQSHIKTAEKIPKALNWRVKSENHDRVRIE